MSVIPENSAQRRTVVIIDQHDLDKLYRYSDPPSFLYDDEITVVGYRPGLQVEELGNSNAITELFDSDLLTPGNVLVQNPFNPDRYEVSENALQSFSVEKHMLFIELCQLLGATAVEVISGEVKDKKSENRFELWASDKTRAVKGSGSLDVDLAEKLVSDLGVKVEFSGGEPDVSAAEKLIKENRLGSDVQFRSLVRMSSNSKNRPKNKVMNINVSSEASRNIELAGKVSAAEIFTGKMRASSKNRNNLSIKLSLKVIF